MLNIDLYLTESCKHVLSIFVFKLNIYPKYLSITILTNLFCNVRDWKDKSVIEILWFVLFISE